MLDEDNAYHNFIDFNGYQPPINAITPESLVTNKAIPENLRMAIITPQQLGPESLQEGALDQ